MSKKSLWYISAGMLLIGYAVLSLLCTAWQMTGHISFDIFRHGKMEIFFKRAMNVQSWMTFGCLILAGLVCFAKAFVGDMIPDLALVGLFGLIGLVAVIAFFGRFFDMFEYRGFRYFINYVYLLNNLLDVAIFCGIAAIILLKSSLGGLFIVPAIAKVLQAGMLFLIRGFGMFGTISYGIAFSILIFLFDMALVGALISVGRAINE